METVAEEEIDTTYLLLSISISLAVLLTCIVFACCFGSRLVAVLETWINQNNGSESDRQYAERISRRQQEEEERNKEDPETRRERLLANFEKNGVTMVVDESAFVPRDIKRKNSDATDDTEITLDSSGSGNAESIEHGNSDDDRSNCPDCKLNKDTALPEKEMDEEDPQGLDMGELILPSDEATNTIRKVSNCCAICLCAYEVNDKVVWSCNKDCPHAFHVECILDYFSIHQKDTPCPCCRREFTDMTHDKNEKVERTPLSWSVLSLFSSLGGRYSAMRNYS